MPKLPRDVTEHTPGAVGGPQPAKPLIVELQKQVEAMRLRKGARPAEQLEIEVSGEVAKSHQLTPIVQAVMENNLSRKGIWATDPDRQRLEWRYETEDLVGSLTVEMSLGQLSTFEMEMVAWILGRWRDNGDGKVRFTLRQCSREFSTQWSGQRAEFLKEALRRIDRTRFTGKVWDVTSRRRVVQHFGIFDRVELVDRADSLDGASTEVPTVTVTLSSFLLEQLRAQQFVRLDWATLRQGIRSALGKRLYVFLEGQKGFPAGTCVVYEATLDRHLIESLGSRDRNPRRLRAKLIRAGQEIMGADERYQEVTVRKGKERGVYVLRARRAA